jgi:excisionase family DNA binding protein
MTVQNACHALGCTEQYVKNLCTAGRLRGNKIGKHAWLVDSQHVAELAERKAASGHIVARAAKYNMTNAALARHKRE